MIHAWSYKLVHAEAVTSVMVIEGFFNFILFIYFIGIDRIDCVTDHCHLEWIVWDNRTLLDAVNDGVCSNGTAIKDLNPNGFNDCMQRK